jgi:hypothetical protein
MRVSLNIIALLCATHTASAATLPKYDTQAFCKNANNLGDASLDNIYDDCIDNEMKAQEQLTTLIAPLPDEDVTKCLDNASTSYVILLGCIDALPVATSPPASEHAESVSREGMRTPATKFHFERDLGIGSVGPDVKKLQIFLNTNGFHVADTGPGSPGHEINVFDANTRAALIEFQQAHAAQILVPYGIAKATGFLGSATREYISKM